jgi:hypothetical protein
MRFLILRVLTHSELGMFHEYRRQGKEGSKQRAVNFDWGVVDRVFPAAKDSDRIEMEVRCDSDNGVVEVRQWLKRQEKNWRLEGHCPTDKCYAFVDPGCLFAMEVDAGIIPASGAWAVFPADGSAEWLYDSIYCARGQSKTLIKLRKSQLASDRTSCRSALANQVRLVLHTAAYWLILTCVMPFQSLNRWHSRVRDLARTAAQDRHPHHRGRLACAHRLRRRVPGGQTVPLRRTQPATRRTMTAGASAPRTARPHQTLQRLMIRRSQSTAARAGPVRRQKVEA